jgi:hypothetical protein
LRAASPSKPAVSAAMIALYSSAAVTAALPAP